MGAPIRSLYATVLSAASFGAKQIAPGGILHLHATMPRPQTKEGRPRPFIMRMYFELLRDAAGQTNQPYDRSVRDLNLHGRGFGRKFNPRVV